MRLPHDEGSQSAARTHAGGSKRKSCDTYWTHRFLFRLVTQFTETTNERAGLGHHRLTFHCHSSLRRGIAPPQLSTGSFVPFTIITGCFRNDRMTEDGSPPAAMGAIREIIETPACDAASDECSSLVRGGCLDDSPNCKAYHLLPGIQNPGLRSSSWKSKSSIFSRSCPCRPESLK